MISKISIKNFKSLENVDIECSNLNILSGLNGMGKSSIIQALLLLRQSYEKRMLENEGLSLNGDLIKIGTVTEALYEFAEKEEISISLEFKNGKNKLNWKFVKKTEQTDYSNSDYMPLSPDEDIPEYYEEFSLFKNNTFKYLNADRWVKNEYELSDYNVVRNRYLGKHGEFTSHFLIHYENEEINPNLIFENGSKINRLANQVSEWMSEISPKIRIKTEKIKGTNSARLRYQFDEENLSSQEISPLNIGFGITYVLPVLVALLSSKKGDILIIENPESHIHPKGQSIIGKMMAKVAQSGVQIFVETHSDHIINGALVSLHKKHKGSDNEISIENLKINFIKRNENSISSEIIPIKIQENARITGIPDDFFDQYSKDMKTLIGF